MTIILAMMERRAKYIEPQDVAAAVLTQGADETRKELVRLMAEAWGDKPNGYSIADPYPYSWVECAWVCEETARGLPQ